MVAYVIGNLRVRTTHNIDAPGGQRGIEILQPRINDVPQGLAVTCAQGYELRGHWSSGIGKARGGIEHAVGNGVVLGDAAGGLLPQDFVLVEVIGDDSAIAIAARCGLDTWQCRVCAKVSHSLRNSEVVDLAGDRSEEHTSEL